jgi:hypothetical protein
MDHRFHLKTSQELLSAFGWNLSYVNKFFALTIPNTKNTRQRGCRLSSDAERKLKMAGKAKLQQLFPFI